MKTYIKKLLPENPEMKKYYQDDFGKNFRLILVLDGIDYESESERIDGEDANDAARKNGLKLINNLPYLSNNCPTAISPRQLRLALLSSGISPDSILNQINLIPDPALKASALIEWEYSSEFKRNHPLVQSISTALALTEEQVDNIFKLGYRYDQNYSNVSGETTTETPTNTSLFSRFLNLFS